MRIIDEIKLDFCDVLIQPKRSETASRSHVSLTKKYKFKNGYEWSGVPLIASNMSATGTLAMARVLSSQKMMTCLHKYYSDEDLISFFKDKDYLNNVFYTLGISNDELERYKKLSAIVECSPQGESRILRVCVDVANGYSKHFVDHLKKVREITPNAVIMAGNVATPEMVQELLISGAADIIKVGIGSGSVCTTRIMAGVGVPQLSAVIECADAAHGLGGHICSDGGCTNSGDVAKAFAAGADFVMLGNLLSGHAECEGEFTQDANGNQIFKFFGMASKEAADKFNGGLKDYRAAEGKCVNVNYKGSVINTLKQITGGLRSACSYTGATSLKDLPKCATFIRVNRTHNEFFRNNLSD